MNSAIEEQLTSLIQKRGLNEHKESILAAALESVALVPSPRSDESIAIGATKLGGNPDLPSSIVWPRRKNGCPLSFIAQINFSELNTFYSNSILPRDGWAYFFIDYEDTPWGERSQSDGVATIYAKGDSNLLRRETPLDEKPRTFWSLLTSRIPKQQVPYVFNSCAINMKLDYTVPELGMLNINFEEDLPYLELKYEREWFKEAGITGVPRVLGFPDPEQTDVIADCQSMFGGESRNWTLLLQVDSVRAAKMMWGDAGTIYFFVPREELSRSDFSNTQMVMQCG